MQFSDGSAEIELRLQLGSLEIQRSKDIFVDADGTCLTVRVNRSGSFITLIETNQLFDKIKPTETIWFVTLNPFESVCWCFCFFSFRCIMMKKKMGFLILLFFG